MTDQPEIPDESEAWIVLSPDEFFECFEDISSEVLKELCQHHGIDERKLLTWALILLSNIAETMPTNAVDGLDSARGLAERRTVISPWRQVIKHLLEPL